MIRYLAAFSAGLAALNTFLLAAPGDPAPQLLLLVIGGVNAFLAATAAFLARPDNGR